jgi:transposase
VRAVLHQAPTHFGHPQSCWTLATVGATCPAVQALSLSGLWRRLRRWGLGRKRSRDHVRSPDPAYQAKEAAITDALAQARAHPTTQILLYGDEFTYYRQPAPGYTYRTRGPGGQHQPHAERAYRSNTKRRVVGALHARTGQVVWASRSTMGVAGLKAWLRQVRAAYGPAPALTLVWDNWPVHTHPEVVAVAAAERITVLWLPTYAPWLNPIEKLWAWLKAGVLRLHPWADQWDALQTQVAQFLEQFAEGSDALLRYVGLAHPEQSERQGAVS